MKFFSLEMVHLALGTLLWAALLFLALDAARNEGSDSPMLFLLVALAALCVWRAPLLYLDMELNRDESQMIAQAMKFRTDFLPWRSVDGGTGGPLVSYAVMWPYLFGMRVSYSTERVTELAFLFFTILFTRKAFALLVGKRRSLLAVLPLVTLYLFTHKPDYVQYCGEDLPDALLAAALWLALGTFQQATGGSVFWLGLLLGAVPFAKLQAGPLAAYLFVVAAAAIFFRGRRVLLVWLIAGTLCIPAAILLPVAAGGVWPDFLSRYVLLGARFRYAGNSPSLFGTFAELLHRGGEVTLLLAGLGLWAAIAGGRVLLQKTGKRVEPGWYGGLVITLGYCLAGFLVVTRSGAIFRHYLLLLLVPASLVACWAWRGLLHILPEADVRRRLGWTVLQAALCVAPVPLSYGMETLYYSFRHRPPGFEVPLVSPHAQYIRAVQTGSFVLFHLDPGFDYASMPPGKVGINAVSRYLLDKAKPGDNMAMWGCMCRCFVQTGMTPATRDPMGGLGLLKDDFYPAAFLSDMKKAMPRFFVDSAHSEGPDPKSWAPNEVRHTDYAPMVEFITQNYSLMAEVRPETGGERVLIYERKQ